MSISDYVYTHMCVCVAQLKARMVPAGSQSLLESSGLATASLALPKGLNILIPFYNIP